MGDSSQETSSLTVLQRWLMVLGSGFVLLGGAVAAVTGPLELAKGSWLAAYLVLVCGVPQYLIGRMISHWQIGRAGWVLLTCWNLGNAAVIAGTLLTATYLVDVGGVILLIPLLLLLWIVIRLKQPTDGVPGRGAITARWLPVVLLLALIVSIPIGLVLAHVRAA